MACVISPYLSMIILACLGETEKKRKERILEEEELRQQIERKYAHTHDNCSLNLSGKTINDMYKR